MPDIIHRIGIKAPAADVYKALTSIPDLAKWWTEETSGDAGLGGKIEFVFRAKGGDVVGKMVTEAQTLEAPKHVRWRVIDGPPDWVGTDLTFDLSEQDGQIIVMFGHRKWAEATESMAHCSMKWAVFLLSLRKAVETGRGDPSPNDLKIDNWN